MDHPPFGQPPARDCQHPARSRDSAVAGARGRSESAASIRRLYSRLARVDRVRLVASFNRDSPLEGSDWITGLPEHREVRSCPRTRKDSLRLRCPVTWLMTDTGPGPMPRTVREPAAICVRPLLEMRPCTKHLYDGRILYDASHESQRCGLRFEQQHLILAVDLERNLGLPGPLPGLQHRRIALGDRFVACQGGVSGLREPSTEI
jgi:hypothetical protein